MTKTRKDKAFDIRVAAAKLAKDRMHPSHNSNGDETKFKSLAGENLYLASFTKGLPHNYENGLVDSPSDFELFVKAIDTGNPQDFKATPLGPKNYSPNEAPGTSWRSTDEETKVRAWESQSAGNTFDLQGPDAQAVTMPPAPKLGSAELTAEMGEVYVQALLRDVPFTEIMSAESYEVKCTETEVKTIKVREILNELKSLAWFDSSKNNGFHINEEGQQQSLSHAEQARVRVDLSQDEIFRGITPGDKVEPYISQFLLSGNTGINSENKSREASDGVISYGANTINQRVRTALACEDYMTTWDSWYDVQQAADFSKLEKYSEQAKYRFIATPRDLATYVHYDALYQAYLNACLLLLSTDKPFDPGLPFVGDDFEDHQQGFAHFGGPHILTLVTEVATRALKAVRFQKFNIHRRMRPEALAARIHKHQLLDVPEISIMKKKLDPILQHVSEINPGSDNFLLPMAFAEGSPMHPAYGAGHATVAGACVTILKAFFDHSREIAFSGDALSAFVPANDGTCLNLHELERPLTVEGELNKLASNISIGRNWAGVHYFTDYIESLRLGEQIAINILEEQKLTYQEEFTMTIPLFDGTIKHI